MVGGLINEFSNKTTPNGVFMLTSRDVFLIYVALVNLLEIDPEKLPEIAKYLLGDQNITQDLEKLVFECVKALMMDIAESPNLQEYE